MNFPRFFVNKFESKLVVVKVRQNFKIRIRSSKASSKISWYQCKLCSILYLLPRVGSQSRLDNTVYSESRRPRQFFRISVNLCSFSSVLALVLYVLGKSSQLYILVPGPSQYDTIKITNFLTSFGHYFKFISMF